MEKSAIILINLILLIVPIYPEVPPYIKVCGRRNPKFNDCIKDSMEHLRGKLSEGMPEFQVPSVEPFSLPGGLTLADTESFKATTDGMKIYGLSAFDIKYLNFDAVKKNLDIDIAFPKLKFTGDYDIKTRILVPINVRGPIVIEAENVSAKVNQKFEFVTKKDGVHMFFPSMTCKLIINDYVSRYVPQPGQESVLAEAITSVLNSNKKEIIATIAGDLEKAVSVKVLQISNQISKHFSYDELVPDRE